MVMHGGGEAGDGATGENPDSSTVINPDGSVTTLNGTYDPATIRGRVRFFLCDTDPTCREPNSFIYSDAEIDLLLDMGGYRGDPGAVWSNTNVIYQTAYADDPGVNGCYPLAWEWIEYHHHWHCRLFISASLRCKVYEAAALGFDRIANEASLLVRIERTSLFSTDTWTTFKAIQGRAEYLHKLARQNSLGGISIKKDCHYDRRENW